MIRIDVINESPDRWIPVIERSFRLTLAPFQNTLGALRVELSSGDTAAGASYTCTLLGTTAGGRRLSIASHHEAGEQAIAHAFTRARRELRRGQLRSPLLPAQRTAARSEVS